MTRHRLGPAAAVSVILSVSFLGVVAGCSSSIPGEGTVLPGEVSAYQADATRLSESLAAEAQRKADAELCARVVISVTAMLESYNAFIAKLNVVQQYPQLEGADLAAISAFDSGNSAIEAKLAGVSSSIATRTRALLRSGRTVVAGIKAQDRAGLNADIDSWSARRHEVVNVCRPLIAVQRAPDSSAMPTPTG